MKKHTKRKTLVAIRGTSTQTLERMAAAMRPKLVELSTKLSYIENELQSRRRNKTHELATDAGTGAGGK